MTERSRGDDGVTLVELLLATSITAGLGTVISAAFFVGVQTTDTANARLAGSQGAQLATSYLPADVNSSATISLWPTPCTGADARLATLSWTDVDASNVSVAKSVTYTCLVSGGRRNLVRQFTAAATTSEQVLAYDVTAASIACTPGCTAPTSAKLTAKEIGGFEFSVTGVRRTP